MIKQPKYVIKIISTLKTQDGTVYYTIQVTQSKNNQTWTFKERYSVLRQIHQKCLKACKNIELPDFPHRKLFGSNNDDFIQKRKVGLEIYYTSLLKEVELEKLPDLFNFFIQHKPKKQQPSKITLSKQQPTNQPKQQANKEKNIKKIFESISNKTISQFIDITNDFYQDLQEEARRKMANETANLKLGLKSHILDNEVVIKTNKQNEFDYFSSFFNDQHEQFIKQSCRMGDQLEKAGSKNTEQIKFIVAL